MYTMMDVSRLRFRLLPNIAKPVESVRLISKTASGTAIMNERTQLGVPIIRVKYPANSAIQSTACTTITNTSRLIIKTICD